MNLQASYQQVEAFIQDKINQDIQVSYVDASTFQISKTISMLMMEKTLSLALRITDLQEGVLSLVIADGTAMMIAGKVIDFLSSLDFISVDDQSNTIQVDLNKIDVLAPVLSRVTVESIALTPDAIALEVNAGM